MQFGTQFKYAVLVRTSAYQLRINAQQTNIQLSDNQERRCAGVLGRAVINKWVNTFKYPPVSIHGYLYWSQ